MKLFIRLDRPMRLYLYLKYNDYHYTRVREMLNSYWCKWRDPLSSRANRANARMQSSSCCTRNKDNKLSREDNAIVTSKKKRVSSLISEKSNKKKKRK